MNILKPSELFEKGDYQKIYYHLNFDSIWLSLFSGIKQYRFFDISFANDKQVSFSPRNDYFHLSNLSSLSKCLEEDVRSVLISINEPRTFSINHKKKILCYLHLDWILALQHLKEVDENNQDIIQYLQFETNISSINKKISHINGTAENRSNIFTVNKNSVIIDLLDDNKSSNKKKLTNNNYKLILENPLLSFIEISTGFDNTKLSDFLKVMNNACSKILDKQTVTNEMKFSLKIRKIKRTYKRGMYISNQNTIIVDPRYVDSFIHELGHWYHTHFMKEIVTEVDAEDFAEKFYLEI